MTDAYDFLKDGEIVQALLNVFTRMTGEVFFFGVVICAVAALTYLQTQSIGAAVIIFLLISGSLLTSHLIGFSTPDALIPVQFQTWLYILVAAGIAGVILFVWFKNR